MSTLDRETGRIYVYELIPVGGTEEEPVFEEKDITPKDVSRIAAQAAKNVIMSSIRDAEREKIYEEYSDRVGESVTGTVQQSDSRYTLIKLREGVEALLPPSEQPHNERYDHNQRIKAYIIEVRKTTNEPSIVVSRTHPGLIRRLFELEVPEIYDGIVEIKSVAREPGMRSKVAVSSRESGLDPVGACVGPKGSRVRMIVSELRGERIDVVPWQEDPETYVANALSPAKVSRVIVDEDTPHRNGHRPRRSALPRHRQGGPERAPGRQAHRLAHRHQEPDAGSRASGISAASRPVRTVRLRRSSTAAASPSRAPAFAAATRHAPAPCTAAYTRRRRAE